MYSLTECNIQRGGTPITEWSLDTFYRWKENKCKAFKFLDIYLWWGYVEEIQLLHDVGVRCMISVNFTCQNANLDT